MPCLMPSTVQRPDVLRSGEKAQRKRTPTPRLAFPALSLGEVE